MSMLQGFYVFLADMFADGDGQLDPATVKERLEEGGFEDVSAHDVREAVNVMYEEGDVFESNQSSVLEAYTGGNQVDQSFNGSNIGVATTTGTATSGSAANTASSAGGSGAAAPGAASAPPPPPPMDPAEGYTELDAAVQQIVYVSNITNNNTTNNVTNIDDRDTFEDNDTVVDSSVNQTILANGDVNQDFDTTIAGEEGIAVAGNVNDANLVTGDNDGVIADDITDSNVVAGDNFGVSGDVEGSAVIGDGNQTQTLVDSDGNVIGDENATGDGSNTGDGNAFGAGSNAGDGNTSTFVNGNNDGVVANGTGGDVNVIEDSTVGAAGFGSGAVTNTVDNSTTDNSDHSIDNSDNSDNSDHSVDNSDNSDNSVDNSTTDNSDNSIDNSIDTTFDVDTTVDASIDIGDNADVTDSPLSSAATADVDIPVVEEAVVDLVPEAT